MTPHSAEEQLAFRPMMHGDLPQLAVWLAEPHVAEWWGGDASETVDAVESRDRERIDGEHHVDPWVIELDAKPIGFVQWYRVEAEAEWFPGITIPAGTVAVDMALGDPSTIGRGVGRRVLLEFVHHVLRGAAPDAPEVWIDPDPRNERAVRAYRAVGFVDTGVDLPDPDHPGGVRRLMRLTFPGPTFH